MTASTGGSSTARSATGRLLQQLGGQGRGRASRRAQDEVPVVALDQLHAVRQVDLWRAAIFRRVERQPQQLEGGQPLRQAAQAPS